MTKPLVVIGLLGATLDQGASPKRWEKWRPTVSLFQHDDLLIDRFELVFQKKFQRLADRVGEDIAGLSPETRLQQHVVEIDDPWNLEAMFGALLDFANAYPFDPEKEDYLIHITTGTHVAQICLFLLTESRHFPARLIQSRPPRKRENTEAGYEVIDLDLSRYDALARRFAEEQADAVSFLKSGIETRNARFNLMMEELEQVAVASRAPILLTGPTGAGKTQLARKVFELKKRKGLVGGPFVEVNCATLRGDHAMSTLFGHRRGAFTGAVENREGLMRAAHGGLLFLDEVGELGLDEQAMLLRALETKTFLPLGSDREVKSDFQLIAGTNRPLEQAVADGKFREDLLARIDLWSFELPSLSERREDIAPNLMFELTRFTQESGDRVSFNREAERKFLSFATASDATWAGNFRDLSAAITRMATLAPGGRIDDATVSREIQRLRRTWRRKANPAAGTDHESFLREYLGDDVVDGIDLFDRVQLAHVVAVCRDASSLSDAGRTLYSESRKSKANPNDADRIRKYLKRWGIDFAELQAFRR